MLWVIVTFGASRVGSPWACFLASTWGGNTDITSNIDTSFGGDAMTVKTKLKAGAASAVPDFLSY
jgi:hypothetical protein